MNGKRVEAERIFSKTYVHVLRSARSLAALAHALRALWWRRRLTSGSHGLARIRQASDCSVAALIARSRLDSEDSLGFPLKSFQNLPNPPPNPLKTSQNRPQSLPWGILGAGPEFPSRCFDFNVHLGSPGAPKSVQNLPKMLPKSIQNPPQTLPWRAPGRRWRNVHEILSFWSPFGVPRASILDQFFMKKPFKNQLLFSYIFSLIFASIWEPKCVPKPLKNH